MQAGAGRRIEARRMAAGMAAAVLLLALPACGRSVHASAPDSSRPSGGPAVIATSTVDVSTTSLPSTTALVPSTTTVPSTTAAPATTTVAPWSTTAASTTTVAPSTVPSTAAALVPVDAAIAVSTTAGPPVVIDEDVAALPDGGGARIAIVVDDAGGPEGFLVDYLALPMPVSISVIPSTAHAPEVAERTHAAGREVLLHLPLANRQGHGDGVTRLNGTETADVVDQFVQAAVDRVPYAVGANNHEGPYGSAQPGLMRELLGSLQQRGLFFMDSVTSQRSVGYAVESEVGMLPRVNNQFLDHDDTDENSRAALIHLALLASSSGTAIGICHVQHEFALHALQAIGPQLQAKGYTFTVLSQVTNRLQGGLDAGMKARIPAG